MPCWIVFLSLALRYHPDLGWMGSGGMCSGKFMVVSPATFLTPDPSDLARHKLVFRVLLPARWEVYKHGFFTTDAFAPKPP